MGFNRVQIANRNTAVDWPIQIIRRRWCSLFKLSDGGGVPVFPRREAQCTWYAYLGPFLTPHALCVHASAKRTFHNTHKLTRRLTAHHPEVNQAPASGNGCSLFHQRPQQRQEDRYSHSTGIRRGGSSGSVRYVESSHFS